MAANPQRSSSESTPAFVVLRRADVPFTAHSYTHDPNHPSYGLEAAEALGVEAARIFKTLMIQADGALCVAVVPVDCTVDLKAAASALGAKRAQMADPAQAQRATGYVLGGISPLGQRKAHRTVIDESAQQHATIFVSGGRRGLEAELAPDALARLTRATFSRVARPTQ